VATLTSGKIVGAALVSHHPGLFQPKSFRVTAGNGQDSDLIEGFARVRAKIDSVKPDIIVILDTHWFTTGCHLIDAGEHYEGTYVSDEMPWYLYGQEYDYKGAPEFAELCAEVALEEGVIARAIDVPTMARHYATINIVNALVNDEKVMSVGSCQTASTKNYLEMGAVLGKAIKRSGQTVVLLASGALSHKFRNINETPKHPRIYHPDNVSSEYNRKSDYRAIEYLCQGEHATILEKFDSEYKKLPWEARGAHYLQMIGALGGIKCTAVGTPLSEYENAHGTGNIHIWFEV
jgi:3,4-dihydroxyphenylacetate 2,3-dioxygenase